MRQAGLTVLTGADNHVRFYLHCLFLLLFLSDTEDVSQGNDAAPVDIFTTFTETSFAGFAGKQRQRGFPNDFVGGYPEIFVTAGE